MFAYKCNHRVLRSEQMHARPRKIIPLTEEGKVPVSELVVVRRVSVHAVDW